MFDRIRRMQDDNACDAAIAAVAAGNRDKLEVIYRIYGKMILSTAYRIVGNTQNAEDVLQDVMLSLMQNASGYTKGTNPRAWVLAMTRNKALDVLRSRGKESIIPPEDIPAVKYDDPALSAQLNEALASLTEEERTLIYFKLHLGLSHAEAASVLGVSVAASEKRYERAMKKLRSYF